PLRRHRAVAGGPPAAAHPGRPALGGTPRAGARRPRQRPTGRTGFLIPLARTGVRACRSRTVGVELTGEPATGPAVIRRKSMSRWAFRALMSAILGLSLP